MRNRAKLNFSPFRFFVPSLQTACVWIICSLVPVLCFLIWKKCFASLLIVFSATAAGFLAGILSNFWTKKNLFFNIWHPILEGFLCGFCIPSKISPIVAFFVFFFAVIVFVYFFGGFQDAIVNPIIITVAFCFLLFPQGFESALTNSEFLASGDSILQLIFSGNLDLLPCESAVRQFFSKYFELPEGYVTFLLDNGSQIVAFRFTFFYLIAATVLISFGIIDWIIPIVFLFVFGFFTRFYSSAILWGEFLQGDVLLSVCSSGIVFYAFFILPTFGSIPQSYFGKVLFSVISGFLAFLLIGPGFSAVGICWTILIADFSLPLIFFIEENLQKWANKQLLRIKGENNEK